MCDLHYLDYLSANRASEREARNLGHDFAKTTGWSFTGVLVKTATHEVIDVYPTSRRRPRRVRDVCVAWRLCPAMIVPCESMIHEPNQPSS